MTTPAATIRKALLFMSNEGVGNDADIIAAWQWVWATMPFSDRVEMCMPRARAALGANDLAARLVLHNVPAPKIKIEPLENNAIIITERAGTEATFRIDVHWLRSVGETELTKALAHELGHLLHDMINTHDERLLEG